MFFYESKFKFGTNTFTSAAPYQTCTTFCAIQVLWVSIEYPENFLLDPDSAAKCKDDEIIEFEMIEAAQKQPLTRSKTCANRR